MPPNAVVSAGVHQQERTAPLLRSWWKGLTQRMNIWRSWVVTWETHLPTAFLLVYWWCDDTEELGLTLYKASLSAASHYFIEHCCWNFSRRTSRTGSSRETSTSPSTMSEVGLFYLLKQRNVGIHPITHDPCASARRETPLMRDLTARRAAVVGGLNWWDFSADMCCCSADMIQESSADSCSVKARRTASPRGTSGRIRILQGAPLSTRCDIGFTLFIFHCNGSDLIHVHLLK